MPDSNVAHGRASLVLTSLLRGRFCDCVNAKHKLAQLAGLGVWQEMTSRLEGYGKFCVCVSFAIALVLHLHSCTAAMQKTDNKKRNITGKDK